MSPKPTPRRTIQPTFDFSRPTDEDAPQELSFAEVKAIASGNPAVLVLAEADAEVQRLSVLRRHHADEQYLARKRVRELPDTIARLDLRLAALEADAATVNASDEFTVGDSPMTDPLLARRLNSIPDHVEHTRRYPLGTFHGLSFGIERRPVGRADVYLEGRSVQKVMLSKESQGPRTVTNALNRIVRDYPDEIAATSRERTLAEPSMNAGRLSS